MSSNMKDVLIMGIGGAGCSLADYAYAVIGCRVVAINTDQRGLDKCPIQERLLIGPRTCNGNAAYAPPEGMRAAEESIDELRLLLAKSKVLVVAAGLGGGTGTGALPVIVKLAQDQGMEVLVAVILPFSFEGPSRHEVAMACLSELTEMGASVIVHDNSTKEQNRSIGFQDLLNKINEEVTCNISLNLKQR